RRHTRFSRDWSSDLCSSDLGALGLAIVLSCTTRLNVGLLALGLAWVIGVYVGDLSVREVTGGFPVNLFLTLAGVTLLFSQARVRSEERRVGEEGWCPGWEVP